jgi:integrase
VNGFCVHSLRSTAATNALEHGADIGKVQEWLGGACPVYCNTCSWKFSSN